MQSRPLHHPAYKRVCKALKEWRLDAGLSQAQLADRLGWPVHTFVQKVEAGERRIDVVELVRWSIACESNPKALVEALAKALQR